MPARPCLIEYHMARQTRGKVHSGYMRLMRGAKHARPHICKCAQGSPAAVWLTVTIFRLPPYFSPSSFHPLVNDRNTSPMPLPTCRDNRRAVNTAKHTVGSHRPLLHYNTINMINSYWVGAKKGWMDGSQSLGRLRGSGVLWRAD